GRRGRAGEGPRRSARALPPVPALREEARTARMKCPFCAELENKVIDSRLSNQGAVIRRRRECLGCERRFTTYERVEEILPMVVKKDGRRENFDRHKVIAGIQLACQKRPVSSEQIEAIVDGIERRLHDIGEQEVPSS